MVAEGKTVTLVLCTRDGRVLGALPAFNVDTPWWQEVGDLIDAAGELHGLEVTVLRLIAAPAEPRSGDRVTYLAEVDRVPTDPLSPWPGHPLADHPLRQGWAKLGGPQQDLAWATKVLRSRGLSITSRWHQIKTWNLSSIWRIPTDEGDAWLKVVPPFMAHEPLVISYLKAACVPTLIGAEPARMLMANIDGPDNFSATGSVLTDMVELLIELQLSCLDRVPELLALGLPDRRLGSIAPRFVKLIDDYSGFLTPAELSGLASLLDGMDVRRADIEACGVPYSLVHGDFHPGNVRGPSGAYVILDWGDSAVGHPLTDELAFFRPLSEEDRQLVGPLWSSAWRAAVPGCDPDRAQALLRPLMPLIAAVIYGDFCAAIEPDELIYHARDVPVALRVAAALAGS